MNLLYILPHAGGAAYSYKVLQDALHDKAEVRCLELPGRGRRACEPCLQSWDAALSEVSRLIDPPPGRTWALFGHSMGALLGAEALSRRAERGLPRPAFFAPSGSPAPAARKRRQIAQLPHDAFWAEIKRYGGVPAEILTNPEFRDYFESILRKDFAIIEGGLPSGAKLDVPVHVFYGEEDMSAKEAESWGDITTGALLVHKFPGDHFFLFQNPREVAAALAAAFGILA